VARRKSPKKKARRKGRAKSRRGGKKSKPMGLGGRIGLAIAGIGPLLFSLFNVIGRIQAAKSLVTIGDKLDWGARVWMNNLSMGLFGKDAFGPVTLSGGQSASTASTETSFAYLKVIGVGVGMVVTDRAVSWVTGKRARKVPFTNINAIGAM